MKYIYQYLFLILCMLPCSSCADYLDKEPDNQLTLEMVFNDKLRVEEWLAGIYTGLPDPNCDQDRDIDAMGDDLNPSVQWEGFGVNIISYEKGNWTPSSHWIMDYWNRLPKKIRAAYLFIENVKPLPEQLLTEEEVEYMKAECRFLIAFFHDQLLKFYGAIPLYTGTVDPSSSGSDFFVMQEPFDRVVDWIDNEYKEVARILPPSYIDTKKYGRITSIASLAARAKLLQFAASPLVNGNPDFRGYQNARGENIFNPVADPKKWVKAKEAYEELLKEADKAGHELYYERLSDGTIDPFLSYQNVMMRAYDQGNKEILFGRVGSGYWSWDFAATPRGYGGSGALGVTQGLVDDFFMSNGLRPILGYNPDGSPKINPASGYTERGFSTEDEERPTRWKEVQGNENQEQNKVTLAGTYNMYCNREARFYVSVLFNDCWFRKANRATDFYHNGKDGGPSHDAPQNGYLVRKKSHPDADPRNNAYPKRLAIIYRLADFYLGYAECLNEIDYVANRKEVLKYVNLIRERAGIPGYGLEEGDVAIPSDQKSMREAILLERRVELNCESAYRFHDIRRWKKKELLSGDFYGMNFAGTLKSDDANNPKAFYKRMPYITRRFVSYWLPVPQTEIDINPNLRQLPGWW